MSEVAIHPNIFSNGHQAVYSRVSRQKNTYTIAEIIKVSAQSRSTSVAGAIAGMVRETDRAEVQAIGAGAVNQAIKASAIARGYLLLDGIDVVIIPSFSDVDIEGEERTAVRLTVVPRQTPPPT